MSREHARVRLSIWADDDFRDLAPDAKMLYFTLLTSPTLSYCGVCDWRPGRIGALIGWPAEQVRAAAWHLAARRYVVVDEDTEELLIRSFIRHDGLMKEARMAVAMATAWAGVASATIRGVVVHELRRLHTEEPDLKGWRTVGGEPGRALDLLDSRAVDPGGLTPGPVQAGAPVGATPAPPEATPTPPVGPTPAPVLALGLGQTQGRVSVGPTPAPTPAPAPPPAEGGAGGAAPRRPRRKPEGRLPDDWTPTGAHRTWARAHGLDLDRELLTFRAHATANDRFQRDWDAAFTQWLAKASPSTGPTRAPLPGPGTSHRTHTVAMPGGDTVTVTDADVERVLGRDVWTPPAPPEDVEPATRRYIDWIRTATAEHHQQRREETARRLAADRVPVGA